VPKIVVRHEEDPVTHRLARRGRWTSAPRQTPAPSPAPAASPESPPAARRRARPSRRRWTSSPWTSWSPTRRASPITGLTKSDFQVTEDDDPQAITDFEAVQLPAVASEKPAPRPRVSTNLDRESHAGRSFVILFDDIHLTLPGGQRAKAAVAQFLKTGVREGDRVSLVATGGGAWWSTRMEAGATS
jgi:hypothetical protein